MHIIFIGNYLPRQCGIATFTHHIANGLVMAANLHRIPLTIEVVAMNDPGQQYDYPAIVTRTIRQQEKQDYIDTAHYINDSGANCVILQHEYGIYGGDSGVFLLQLIKNLKVPLITTLHTVLKRPNYHQKEVLQKIAAYSAGLIVMSPLAIDLLNEIYDIPPQKINLIEHGVPDFSNTNLNLPKVGNHWEGKKIIMTFGLLGRNKGIETVIRALPALVKIHKNLLYFIVGKTHPHVVKQAGEEYRYWLIKLIHELGLDEHVAWVNEYVEEPALMAYLKMADIYVTPYQNKAQITSGALSYALGGGCAVLSTPYWHASQLASQGLVKLFPFGDSAQLSIFLEDWLGNDEMLEREKNKAKSYGHLHTWLEAGSQYRDLALSSLQAKVPAEVTDCLIKDNSCPFSTRHLERMTDETGIIQHALGSVPLYQSGYCLDDNARALLICIMAHQQGGNERLFHDLLSKYLGYILYMHEPDGRLLNLCTYERERSNADISEDAFGRAIWALGHTIRFAPSDSVHHLAHILWHSTMQKLNHLHHIRGYANAILGIYHYCRRYPDQEIWQQKAWHLADQLCKAYELHRKPGWEWFEDVMTYDNGLMPAALYKAYALTLHRPFREIADITADFLEKKCWENNNLSLIGNRQWYRLDEAYFGFGQQPIDALAMVVLFDAKYKLYQEAIYLEKMEKCLQWFCGLNDLNIPLYDVATGGCHDGLENHGVNYNQGAESTIAYLLSWLIVNQHKGYPVTIG